MKIFNIVAIFIYTFLFSIIGALFIALSLRTESLDSAVRVMNYLFHMNNFRLGMAFTGFLLILVNISIAQLSLGKLQKNKTIAFQNPNGQVTLALSAIEDYIKRLTNNMKEIKEIKSHVSVTKAGMEIVAKTTLYAEVNIPEATEKIQNAIRSRLQEILGIEEKVTIKINVTKIAQRERNIEPKGAAKGTEQSGFKGEIEYGR